MKTLLILDSSARINRSITRHLTQRAAAGWLSGHPDRRVHRVDLGITPPPAIDESWIAAAYTRAPLRTSEMIAALRASDRYVDQLIEADAIVIGAPLYNFGMPAQLKAYLEQVVRIGRTFDFGPTREQPYVGLLANKPTLVATSSGSPRITHSAPGAEASFLEPQLLTTLRLMGITDVTFASLRGQQEDATHVARALAEAEHEVDAWLARNDLVSPVSGADHETTAVAVGR